MSGGSYDYICFRMDEVASQLAHSSDPLRRAFSKKMRLFAKAMHDIEWVDSSDTAPGSEVAAINAALGNDAHSMALAELITDAQSLITSLEHYTKPTPPTSPGMEGET